MGTSKYQVNFARSARKELENLETALLRRVWERIEALATTPYPIGAKKLVGSQNLWRIRIGDYRVVYGVNDESCVVDVIAVRHRKDAYR